MVYGQLDLLNMIPQKQLGQHFLVQKSAVKVIADSALAATAPRLLEIGPGQGAITESLLADGRHLWAVDLDPIAIKLVSERFREFDHFHPVCGDAVSVPLNFDGPISVVGNLPYNAATAILTRFLLQPIPWERMVFMFQLEVGRKLMGKPGDREYGPLSILTQLTCQLSRVIKLGPMAFYPAPKVDSIVILFKPKKSDLPLNLRSEFLALLRVGFKYRRKTLANNLRELSVPVGVKKIFKMADLPENIRAEAISPDVWLNIFNIILSFA